MTIISCNYLKTGAKTWTHVFWKFCKSGLRQHLHVWSSCHNTSLKNFFAGVESWMRSQNHKDKEGASIYSLTSHITSSPVQLQSSEDFSQRKPGQAGLWQLNLRRAWSWSVCLGFSSDAYFGVSRENAEQNALKPLKASPVKTFSAIITGPPETPKDEGRLSCFCQKGAYSYSVRVKLYITLTDLEKEELCLHHKVY